MTRKGKTMKTILICVSVLAVWESLKYIKSRLSIDVYKESIDVTWWDSSNDFCRSGIVILSIPKTFKKA